MTPRQPVFRAAAATTAAALALGLVAADRPATSVPADLIGGPYARMLAESTDLGPGAGALRLPAAAGRS